MPTWSSRLCRAWLRGVLLRAKELFGCPVRVVRCRERSLERKPLAGFVTFDDAIPALRSGGVAAELDHVGVGESFGDEPSAPG